MTKRPSNREAGGRSARRGEAFWRSAVKKWKRSGMSRAAFCEKEGLIPNTLTWWKWRISTSDVSRSTPRGRRRRRKADRGPAEGRRPRARRAGVKRTRVGSAPAKARARRTRQQAAATSGDRAEQVATFLPVRVMTGRARATHQSDDETSQGSPPLEVVTLGGRRIQVRGDFDATVLAKLVATLESLPC